jgi:hypothetical protein
VLRRFASRGSWLLALACLAFFAAAAHAQDPRATAAQGAARAWLALVDKGDAQASYAAAGKKFQDQLDAAGWRDALTKVREPLGALVDRTALATRFDTKLPGGPDGDYAQVLFESEYANGAKVRETVTLEREPDGVWRVMGYLIR